MRIRDVAAAILAAVSLTACGSTQSANAPTSTTDTTSTTSTTSTSSGNTSAQTCPKASQISAWMGSTYTGPIAANSGAAGCNYDGGSNEVYVLFGQPGLSLSQFTTQSKSGLGPTAQALSGLGGSAFVSTAYGHAEVDVYVSSSRSFSVSVVTADAVVKPGNLAQVEAVARAIVAS
ncbi:MAG: hypothetical protein ABSD78_17350 [Acidimicrobiales bacterium]